MFTVLCDCPSVHRGTHVIMMPLVSYKSHGDPSSGPFKLVYLGIPHPTQPQPWTTYFTCIPYLLASRRLAFDFKAFLLINFCLIPLFLPLTFATVVVVWVRSPLASGAGVPRPARRGSLPVPLGRVDNPAGGVSSSSPTSCTGPGNRSKS